MVAPVNEIDKILQLEPKRTLAPRGGVVLSPSANVVKVAGGVGNPSIVTLVATPLSLSGAVVFTTAPTVPLTLDSTGLIATLHYADMGTSSVVVTATLTSNGIPYADSKTISQVVDGANGISGFLDNESVTLAADSSGAVSSFAPASGTFHVLDGVTDMTGNAAVVYSVTGQSGCSVAITAAGAISVSAMTTDTATATLQAAYKGATIQKILSLAKARAGSQGQPGTGTPGQPGSRGAGHYYASGSAWSDTAAAAACPGGAPVVNDVVTISNNSTFVMEKIWSGTSWNTQGTVVNGNLLVSGSVTAAALSIGQLSSISATIGTLRTATTGGRVEISDNVIKVFDTNVLRVKLGNLSL